MAFGKALSEDSVVRYQVAECRMEIAQARKSDSGITWRCIPRRKKTPFFLDLQIDRIATSAGDPGGACTRIPEYKAQQIARLANN